MFEILVIILVACFISFYLFICCVHIGIIRRADKLYYGQDPAFIGIFLFNVLNFLIPIVKLIVWSNSVTDSIWLYVFIVSSTIINMSFGLIVYNLLYVAIFGKCMCECVVCVCCVCVLVCVLCDV